MSEEVSAGRISTAFHGIEYFADLILVATGLVACVLVIFFSDQVAPSLRYVLAIPAIFFIPGYSLTAALFPKDNDIRSIERIALSLGLSLAVVPLIGLGLNFTPWGIRLDPLVISLSLFTLSMILVAFYRRANLPCQERFVLSFQGFKDRTRGFLSSGESKIDRFISIVLTLVILISVLTTIYVLVFPKEGGQFTEFFILGENRTADNYPDRIVRGQDYPMYVGIGNHESGEMNYTVETWLLREEFDAVSNTSHIMAMDPHDRLFLSLADNQTVIIPYNLSVTKSGYNRVEFLLFKDSIPGPDVSGSSRIDASYQRVNLWVQVQ